MTAAKTKRCPDCDGFGYHEDGTEDGRECETCKGSGVVKVVKVVKS